MEHSFFFFLLFFLEMKNTPRLKNNFPSEEEIDKALIMLTTKSKELNDAEKDKDVVSKNLVRVRKEIEQNETKKNDIIDQIEDRETMASKFFILLISQ